MNHQESAEWREMYKLALFEPDPEKLAMRIENAREAIRWRICELWDLGTTDTKERSQLDAATYFLGLLHSINARKTPATVPYSAFPAGNGAA